MVDTNKAFKKPLHSTFTPAVGSTRDQLLHIFLTRAATMGVDVTDGDSVSLLASLIAEVPAEAFAQTEPNNKFMLVGIIESSSDEEDECGAQSFIADIEAFHFYEHDLTIPLEIVMSSNGGDIAAGNAIISAINMIRRHGREVRIHVAGYALSVAFDILQFADYRSCEPTAILMTHADRNLGVSDDADAFTHKYEGEASIAQMKLVYQQIAERTGRNADWYLQKIKGKPWYLTPPQALEEGLLDEIVGVPKFTPTLAKGVATPRKRAPKKNQPAEETPAA